MNSHRKIFITGIAGFIGFHLANYLNECGEQVYGIDNFNSYYDVKLKQSRADQLRNKGIQIVEGNICDFALLDSFFKKQQYTHLIHLAAQAGVRYSITHPHDYVSANISGFLNILEICRKYTATKLIYASSSSVYGRNTKIPFSIEDPTDHQASFYGVTKKTNELMADTYHHLYNIPVIGLRFFTVYGPWGRPDMAYYSFARAISEGHPIEVFNNGIMMRDFTYIDDIIQGIVSAMHLDTSNELFNLGNHRPESLMSLIHLLEENLGRKAILVYKPMQSGDVENTFADITHSQNKLGFQPKITLKEGISRFVNWYNRYKDFGLFY